MKHSARRVKLWWEGSQIFGRISLPSSGDGNLWPLVSHDPSGLCATSWRMTGGMSRPVSLFSPGLPWWILMASLILLLDTWSSLSNILASFRLHLWPTRPRVSACGVFFVSCPQGSARFPNVYFVTDQCLRSRIKEAWTYQLSSSNWCLMS